MIFQLTLNSGYTASQERITVVSRGLPVVIDWFRAALTDFGYMRTQIKNNAFKAKACQSQKKVVILFLKLCSMLLNKQKNRIFFAGKASCNHNHFATESTRTFCVL